MFLIIHNFYKKKINFLNNYVNSIGMIEFIRKNWPLNLKNFFSYD